MTGPTGHDKARVTRIWQEDERTLGLAFTTGRKALYDVVWLRRRCPCAHCLDEFTGERLLAAEDVPETVRPRFVRSVGRYALTVGFTDGHDTGIYPLDWLARVEGPGVRELRGASGA